MKTLLREDSLYKKIIYNYHLVIEKLCQKCESFNLYCFYELSKDEDLLDVANTILSYETNRMLKNSFSCITQCKKNDFRLNFKIDENSRNWLLMREGFKSFYERNNRGYIINVDKNNIKQITLEDPEFIDENNNILLRYDKFYRELYINDESEFFQCLNKEIEQTIHKKQIFISEFTNMKNKQSQMDIISHFSSNEYDIDLFFEYLKYKNDKEYPVNDFYFTKENIELCIKIIISKLKKQYDMNTALMLFEFYEKDYLDTDEINYNTKYIDKYVLSLNKKVCLQLLNAVILGIRNCRKGCVVMDKVIELICESGLMNDSSKLILPSKFIAGWLETYYVDDFKINWKLLTKKESLLTLFYCYFNNDQKEILQDSQCEIEDKYINSSNVQKTAYAYFYGIMFKQDYRKAVKLFIKLSNIESNINCQYDLARCYLNGWGAEKNVEQAKYWFKKAAENGHPKAQEQLDLLIDNDV